MMKQLRARITPSYFKKQPHKSNSVTVRKYYRQAEEFIYLIPRWIPSPAFLVLIPQITKVRSGLSRFLSILSPLICVEISKSTSIEFTAIRTLLLPYRVLSFYAYSLHGIKPLSLSVIFYENVINNVSYSIHHPAN
jgi:hypothetical protein